MAKPKIKFGETCEKEVTVQNRCRNSTATAITDITDTEQASLKLKKLSEMFWEKTEITGINPPEVIVSVDDNKLNGTIICPVCKFKVKVATQKRQNRVERWVISNFSNHVSKLHKRKESDDTTSTSKQSRITQFCKRDPNAPTLLPVSLIAAKSTTNNLLKQSTEKVSDSEMGDPSKKLKLSEMSSTNASALASIAGTSSTNQSMKQKPIKRKTIRRKSSVPKITNKATDTNSPNEITDNDSMILNCKGNLH